MGLLVRDIVITPSENSSLFNGGLKLKYWRYKRNVNMLFFIANLINYIFYLNKLFASVLLPRYRQTTEKVYLFSSIAARAHRILKGTFYYIQWEALISMNTKIQIFSD